MRIVVKVGTSTLAHPGGLLNIRHTEDLVKVWSDIQNAGHQLLSLIHIWGKPVFPLTNFLPCTTISTEYKV